MRVQPTTTSAHDLPGLPGLPRVSWVRVSVDEHGARAEAFGVAHRRPVVVPLALRTAMDLARRGVPTVVRRAVAGAAG